MLFSAVINQTSYVSNSRKQKPKKSLKMLGFEDLEDDSRSVVQNPVSFTKVCELVVTDHQVTLRLRIKISRLTRR
jgi:hypothetical protein